MRIGIDLGGTKIEGIALEPGREPVRVRRPTPTAYDPSLDAIVAVVRELEERTGARGSVGVGIPGTVVEETGLVKNANSTWLIGRPLVRDLSGRLERPVRVMNDANCFALSEATDGAAAGARVVFGVILGTGVGGGIVVDGRVWVGPNRIAGEWGHNPLPAPDVSERPGPECYCGRRACIETFLSGPGMAFDHRESSGQALEPPEIVERASRDDPAASATLERYRDRLARALGGVVNVLDPDVIVLGGGMSRLPGLAPATAARLPPYVFSEEIRTRVVDNRHGDSSGVRGAAWLWPEGEEAGT